MSRGSISLCVWSSDERMGFIFYPYFLCLLPKSRVMRSGAIIGIWGDEFAISGGAGDLTGDLAVVLLNDTE